MQDKFSISDEEFEEVWEENKKRFSTKDNRLLTKEQQKALDQKLKKKRINKRR